MIKLNVDKILKHCCRRVILAIRKNITGNVFKHPPFGHELAESTKAYRRKTKRGQRYIPLSHFGLFKLGFKFVQSGKEQYTVYSDGRSEKAQEAFTVGVPERNIPPRDVFREDQPGSRGQTIEDDCIAYAAKEVFAWADKVMEREVRKANARTRR